MALVEGGQQTGGPGEVQIDAPDAAGGVASPAWATLPTDIETFRATITGRGEAHRASIRSTAEAEAARFRAAVEAEAQAVDDAHQEAIDAVRGTADADTARIDAALDAKLAAVDAVATAERANLDDTVVAKQAAVRTRGASRGDEAGTTGTRLANKATGGTQERVNSAQAIAGTKRNRYATVENRSEIVEAINSSTRDLVAKLTRIGSDMASGVRAKTTEMACKIRKEADDVAAKFASVRADARAQIDEGVETTKTQMRRIAGDTKAKIAEQEEKATTTLQDQRAGRVAEIRARADTADAVFAEQATAAEQEVSTREAADLADLATFETRAAEAGWYAPFVDAARVELTAALEERQAGTAELVAQVSAQFTAAGDELIADVSSQAQELAGGARKVAEEFATAGRSSGRIRPRVGRSVGVPKVASSSWTAARPPSGRGSGQDATTTSAGRRMVAIPSSTAMDLADTSGLAGRRWRFKKQMEPSSRGGQDLDHGQLVYDLRTAAARSGADRPTERQHEPAEVSLSCTDRSCFVSVTVGEVGFGGAVWVVGRPLDQLDHVAVGVGEERRSGTVMAGRATRAVRA